MASGVRTRLRNNIPEIEMTAAQRTRQAVRETTMAINTRAKLAMAEPHTGRMYGNHQASAPGEAPAIDTGLLVNSLQEYYEGDTGYAYTNVEYAVHLEYGAPKGNLAPRPFYRPAAEAERPEFIKRMRRVY